VTPRPPRRRRLGCVYAQERRGGIPAGKEGGLPILLKEVDEPYNIGWVFEGSFRRPGPAVLLAVSTTIAPPPTRLPGALRIPGPRDRSPRWMTGGGGRSTGWSGRGVTLDGHGRVFAQVWLCGKARNRRTTGPDRGGGRSVVARRAGADRRPRHRRRRPPPRCWRPAAFPPRFTTGNTFLRAGASGGVRRRSTEGRRWGGGSVPLNGRGVRTSRSKNGGAY